MAPAVLRNAHGAPPSAAARKRRDGNAAASTSTTEGGQGAAVFSLAGGAPQMEGGLQQCARVTLVLPG